EMAKMSLDDGLVLQIHPGSHRNHNPSLFEHFGRDMGADIPTQTSYVEALKPLLDAVGNERNLTVIAFTLDVRSPDATVMDALDRDIRAALGEIAKRRRVEIALDQIWRKPPTIFDGKLVDAVQAAATELGYSYRRITSGAGHDACNVASVIPAAMIFGPCKDGVSHNELEDATQADCSAGANVLLHAVLAVAGVAK
ncbi:MAG: M20/M25/M40 family metallo-hydrolase, partial [Rhizobiales bacterium]|nr:M20/M25/M40 family metallo-hydrolase [Hyphomicrobiales bacterium]